MRTTAIAFGVRWLLLFVTYLAFVGQISSAEAVAGSTLSLIAAVALFAVQRKSRWTFAWRFAWLRTLAPVPVRAVSDALVVLRANCVRPFRTRGSGRFLEREFNPGNDQALSKARRALVTAAISLPPNSFVVAVDRERHRLLVHELVPQPETTRDPDWPL